MTHRHRLAGSDEADRGLWRGLKGLRNSGTGCGKPVKWLRRGCELTREMEHGLTRNQALGVGLSESLGIPASIIRRLNGERWTAA